MADESQAALELAAAPPCDPGVAAPLDLVARVAMANGDGPGFTEEEQARWDEYLAAHAVEHARRATVLGLVDIGDVIENGVEPARMLVPDLIVEGRDHAVYGPKEQGKTWLMLQAAARLIKQGRTVLWVDKEMGRADIALRLEAFGVAAEEASEHFVYLEFPTMSGSAESVATFEALLALREPVLMVVDAQTEVLADAALSENLATDVEQWRGWYLTPARKMGCSTVMLDHTGHETQGRQRGSGHKGAAAMVELEVVKMNDFDKEQVGRIKVRLRKNTCAAPIPKSQEFRIGGTPFVLDTAMPDYSDGGVSTAYQAILDALRTVLAKHKRLTTGQAKQLVSGKAELKVKALQELAEGGEVEAEPGGNNSVTYTWIGDANANDLSVSGGTAYIPPEQTEQTEADERTQTERSGNDRTVEPGNDRTQAERPERTQPERHANANATCEQCGKRFEAKRANATYCKSSCRSKAARARKAAS
jgi:hypothetical protein